MAKIDRNLIKVGDKVRIKNNKYISYSINKGDVLEVLYMNHNNLTVNAPSYGNVNITFGDIESPEETKEMIETQIAEAEATITEANLKLDFMKKNKLTVFDPEEYKVFQVLETVDKKGVSQIEKAKAIAKLIRK